MSAERLPHFRCPTCQQAVEREPGAEHGTCVGCDRSWLLIGHLCPSCSSYQRDESVACAVCGYALSRVCPSCRTRNWTGDDACRHCSQPLSLLNILPQTNARDTSTRLLQQMNDAAQIRIAEAQDSARRMRELEALERERLTVLQAQRQQRAARERRMLVTAFVAAALVLVALLLYGLLATV